MLIARYLDKTIKDGCLGIIDANGKRYSFGDPSTGPSVTLRFHDPALHWQLALNPELRFPEAYVDGDITVEDGTLGDFLWIAARNLLGRAGMPDGTWETVILKVRQWLNRRRAINPLRLTRRRIAHHYDLSGDLFALFLDEERSYSCAYFSSPDEDLESAQARKKRRLAAKLDLKPGQRVLDVGSGWGGLALYLNRIAGVDVSGVTLSSEQLAYATRLAEERGVADHVRFDLKDYRLIDGKFDRIVSVGMFEHVGPSHYEEFFAKMKDLLDDDGVGVLHSIGRFTEATPVGEWIERYIFPGGYTPSLSEVTRATERVGLWVTDIEVLRLHYAETLKHWHDRFQARRAEAAALYDERFCRMWEFYLKGCEMAFREGPLMVFQLQFAKRRDAVPVMRSYITDNERALLRAEEKQDDRAA